MSTSGGKPYHHGDLRSALLVAARELVADPAKLTLRAVAARAGVSPAAPYRHFTDRDSLLAGLAEQGFAELIAAMTMPQDVEPALAWRRAGAAYLRFAAENPELYRLMFDVGALSRTTYPGLADADARLDALLGAALHCCQAAGVFAAHDPADITNAMRCLMHGMTSMVMDGRQPVAVAMDAARRVMDVVDAGLLPR